MHASQFQQELLMMMCMLLHEFVIFLTFFFIHLRFVAITAAFQNALNFCNGNNREEFGK